MNWGSVRILAMGGYALYVWGSYGAVLVLMVASRCWPAPPRIAERGRGQRVGQSIGQD
jgi:hypothetical protein